MGLGKNIIKIRKENNLTQDELAEKYFVTRQTISNWEIGKSYPDLETLVKLSNDFNISLDRLLKDDYKMVKNINNDIKNTKKYKYILKYTILLIIIIILIFSVYTIRYFHIKNMTTNRFESTISKYNFIKDDYEMYHLIYNINTEYIMLNPKLPNFLEFNYKYENNLLYCFVVSESIPNQLTKIVWNSNESINMNTISFKKDTINLTNINNLNGEFVGTYENNVSKINFEEASKKLRIDKNELKEVINKGNEIYNNLYKKGVN